MESNNYKSKYWLKRGYHLQTVPSIDGFATTKDDFVEYINNIIDIQPKQAEYRLYPPPGIRRLLAQRVGTRIWCQVIGLQECSQVQYTIRRWHSIIHWKRSISMPTPFGLRTWSSNSHENHTTTEFRYHPNSKKTKKLLICTLMDVNETVYKEFFPTRWIKSVCNKPEYKGNLHTVNN